MDCSHEYFMEAALEQARLAGAAGEVPVGAVVVVGGSIVARAHNEVERGRDATLHAELLAIQRASEVLGRWRLTDAEVYVTLEPCSMCIGAMILSRVARLCYGCADPKQGAVGSLFDLSDRPELPHQLAVTASIKEAECRALLQEFFERLRASERDSRSGNAGCRCGS